MSAWRLLLQTYGEQADAENVRRTAEAVLARFPSDPAAQSWLARAATLKPTPDIYVDRSMADYQSGKFEEAIKEARAALALQPDLPEAWNNIAAAENGLGHWDEAIEAARQAVRLKPDYQLAKNNLAWSRRQKQKSR